MPSGDEEKKKKKNTAAIRTLNEMLNAHDLQGALTVIAEDVVDHNPASPAPGRKGFEILHGMIMPTAFPDMRVEIEDLIAADDRVVTRVRMQGTNQGPFMGIPPSNAKVSATGMEIYRLVDGIIVEHWAQFDLMGIMRQLGAIVALPLGPPGPPGPPA